MEKWGLVLSERDLSWGETEYFILKRLISSFFNNCAILLIKYEYILTERKGY